MQGGALIALFLYRRVRDSRQALRGSYVTELAMSTPRQLHDVKAISFEGYDVSSDGELVIFTVRDKAGNAGHIAVDWLALSTTVQLIGRGAERAAQARKQLGKSDDFKPVGGLTAQMVST